MDSGALGPILDGFGCPGVPFGRLGASWGRVSEKDEKNETLGRPLGRLWDPLGAHWLAFGIPWGAFGRPLGSSLASWAPCWCPGDDFSTTLAPRRGSGGSKSRFWRGPKSMQKWIPKSIPK